MNHLRCAEKLAKGQKLKVLFLNDVGFLYGAGIAQFRQAQSFLLQGHRVGVFCWVGASQLARTIIPYGVNRHLWLGARTFSRLHHQHGSSDAEIVEDLLAATNEFAPDLVIVGNLHGAQWPLSLLDRLREQDFLTVVYLHDCYLLTGRCAYPGSCRKFLTGCDRECPTAEEYPSLSPREIAAAWQYRRYLFTGSEALPVATNSHWLCNLFAQAFPEHGFSEVVYLGLDTSVYRPIAKSLARKLLGFPEDVTIILFGAVNLEDQRKGGDVLQMIVGRFKEKAKFVVFGENSGEVFKDIESTGRLVSDFRKMPLLFSAADLYLFTSREEAFGQTVMEASASAVPVVAFNAGGVGEIAINGLNAILLEEMTVAAMGAVVEDFLSGNLDLTKLGQAGRDLVTREFSLMAQAQAWERFLARVAGL